jgi:hypothetical protein
MAFQKRFEVANPSPYRRSDYVEVDLEWLNVPPGLGELTLKLSRLSPQGGKMEIPYQIDSIFGKNVGTRVMTFLATEMLPRPDDYSQASGAYLLEEARPTIELNPWTKQHLWVKHYHTHPVPGEPPDGCNDSWDPQRKVYGVKLCNDALEVYFSLVPHPRFPTATNYVGSATSVLHLRARELTGAGEMLAPYGGSEAEQARWGQLTQLVFFTLPWERRWYHTESLLRDGSREREYTLAWSHSANMRAVVSFKSDPITIRYVGQPYFHPNSAEVTCHLYRVLSFYPGKEYYTENLYIRTLDGLSLASRAYFSSFVYCPWVPVDLVRLEEIPDYFAVWRHFSEQYRGYAFSADSHCREVALDGHEIRWRLQLGHNLKCLHYFMFYYPPHPHPDFMHNIGHNGWYERVFKPLEVIPLNRYLTPDPNDALAES